MNNWDEVWERINDCDHDFTSDQLWVDPNGTRLLVATCRECHVGRICLQTAPEMTGRWLAERLEGLERVA